MFSPRSRALTFDIAWSLAAAIATVALINVAQNSWPFFASSIETAAPAEEQQEQPETAVQTAFEPQFDRDGTLVDNLPFSADDGRDTAASLLADEEPVDPPTSGAAAPSSQTAASSSATTSAPNQPTASTAPTSQPSAERPPASSPSPPPREPSNQERIEAIADRLPFNWRAAGVTLKAECAPNRSHCQWGLYTVANNTVWVGTDAFANNARLFYVVAHELAHAWQFSNDPHARMNDLTDWGRTGVDGLEAAADCLAQVWGASTTHYWSCPSDAQRHIAQVFNAN